MLGSKEWGSQYGNLEADNTVGALTGRLGDRLGDNEQMTIGTRPGTGEVHTSATIERQQRDIGNLQLVHVAANPNTLLAALRFLTAFYPPRCLR